MDKYFDIHLLHATPVVTAAIHDGHHLSHDIARLIALDDHVQLREEDPYTGVLARVSENHFINGFSRFEFDLNRPPEKAIYLTPEDAWGLQVWKHPPSWQLLEKSRFQYAEIYRKIHAGLGGLVERYGTIVVLDLHSYNHRRSGPHAPPADPVMNPEINIGTGTMDREYWAFVVDRFIHEFSQMSFFGRKLDVRENVKFRGGYFPKWIHENFRDSVCCISVEVKKFFMDEWTGEPDWDSIRRLEEMLKTLIPVLLEQIRKKGNNRTFNAPT